MAEPLSTDLRERVVAAVEGGMSRRQAAAHFRVGVSSAIPLGRTGPRYRRSAAEADGRGSSVGGDRGSGRDDPVAFGRRAGHDAHRVSGGAGEEGPSLQRVDDLAVSRSTRPHAKKRPRTRPSKSAPTS